MYSLCMFVCGGRGWVGFGWVGLVSCCRRWDYMLVEWLSEWVREKRFEREVIVGWDWFEWCGFWGVMFGLDVILCISKRLDLGVRDWWYECCRREGSWLGFIDFELMCFDCVFGKFEFVGVGCVYGVKFWCSCDERVGEGVWV